MKMPPACSEIRCLWILKGPNAFLQLPIRSSLNSSGPLRNEPYPSSHRCKIMVVHNP